MGDGSYNELLRESITVVPALSHLDFHPTGASKMYVVRVLSHLRLYSLPSIYAGLYSVKTTYESK